MEQSSGRDAARRWHYRAALALLLCAVPAALAGPCFGATQAPHIEHTVRWHSLRSLVDPGTVARQGVDLRTHAERSSSDGLEPASWGVFSPRREAVTLDECARWIERVLRQSPGCKLESIDLRRGRLRVTGNAAAQARASQVAGQLADALTETRVVEVYRLPSASIPAGTRCVLGPMEVSSLLTATGPARAIVEHIPTSTPWTIGAESMSQFLEDYWTEASSDAFFADPFISVVPSGMQVGLRLDRTCDGRWAVRAWASSGDMERPVRAVPIKGFGGSPLELPSTRSAVGASSGIIPEGGALLAQFLPEECLLVKLRAPESRTAEPVPFVSLGEWTAPAMRMAPIGLPYAEWMIYGGRGEEDWADLMPMSAPWATKPVGPVQFAGEVLGIPGSDLHYFRVGSALISTDAKARSELLRAMTEFQHGLSPLAAEFEFAYGPIPAATANLPTGEAECAALANTLPMRAQASCLGGDALALVGATERCYLLTHGISFGNSVTPNSPVVSTAAEGISLWVEPVAEVGGALRLSLQAIYQAPHGEFARGQSPALLPWAGPGAVKLPHVPAPNRTFVELPIELPTTRRAVYRGAGTYAPDRWHTVTVQDLGDGENAFALMMRVRLR